jgi:hypothetical protein
MEETFIDINGMIDEVENQWLYGMNPWEREKALRKVENLLNDGYTLEEIDEMIQKGQLRF